MSTRTIAFFCVAATLVTTARAQITLMSTDIGPFHHPGKVVLIDTATSATPVSVGTASAASQNFDFSGLTFHNKSSQTFVDPASTPNSTMFKGATSAYADTMTLGPTSVPGYTYIKLTTTGFFNLGFGSAGANIAYTNGVQYLGLPITAATTPAQSWQSHEISTPVPPIIPGGVKIDVVGTCDAWGRLITQRGNFGCLRFKISVTRGTEPPDPTFPTTTTYSYIYATRTGEFFTVELADSNQAGQPQATAKSIEYDHPNVAAAVDEGSMPVAEGLFDAYPNPAISTGTFAYLLKERSMVTAELVNMLGERVVSIATGAQSEGLHSTSFDVSHLAPGPYLSRLTVNGVTSVRPIVVVK